MQETTRSSPSGPASVMPMIQKRTPSAGAQPDPRLAAIRVDATNVILKEHDRVFSQGDLADAVYYVLAGRVSLAVVSGAGKEAVLGFAVEGQFFGTTCLTGARTRNKTATAMTRCELLRIDRDVVARALHRDGAFADLFIEGVLTRSLRSEADLVDQLLNSSEKRLARALLLLAGVDKEASPENRTLQVTQETLAQIVGTTRSRVNSFMNKFRALGMIDYGQNGLHVHRSLLTVVLR